MDCVGKYLQHGNYYNWIEKVTIQGVDVTFSFRDEKFTNLTLIYCLYLTDQITDGVMSSKYFNQVR